MIRHCLVAGATGLLLAAGSASAVTLTFEDLAEGTTLGSQYAALGVVFSPNAFFGLNSNTSAEPWATNTGMTITATDIGALGSPLLVSGKVLHSFGDWLAENGDASMLATFSAPISFISMAFAGIFTGADVTLTAYNGSTLLGTVAGTTCASTCQQTLSFSAASITRVAFTPGSFNDWVAVDNITYTLAAVPEPGTLAMLGAGLGLLACMRRKAA